MNDIINQILLIIDKLTKEEIDKISNKEINDILIDCINKMISKNNLEEINKCLLLIKKFKSNIIYSKTMYVLEESIIVGLTLIFSINKFNENSNQGFNFIIDEIPIELSTLIGFLENEGVKNNEYINGLLSLDYLQYIFLNCFSQIESLKLNLIFLSSDYNTIDDYLEKFNKNKEYKKYVSSLQSNFNAYRKLYKEIINTWHKEGIIDNEIKTEILRIIKNRKFIFSNDSSEIIWNIIKKIRNNITHNYLLIINSQHLNNRKLIINFNYYVYFLFLEYLNMLYLFIDIVKKCLNWQ